MKQYYVFSLPKDQPLPKNGTRFIAVKVKDCKPVSEILAGNWVWVDKDKVKGGEPKTYAVDD